MKLEGEYIFKNAPRKIVWETLMDPDALSKAIPGGDKLEKVGDNQYEAALNIKVGPVQGKFDGDIELLDINEPDSYKMKVSGKGPAGFLNGEGNVTLSDGGNDTIMSYSGDAQVGGKIAGVGQRLIDSSAKSITRQGLEALDAQIQAKVAGGDASATIAKVAAPSTTAMAATVAKDVTKDTMSGLGNSVTGLANRVSKNERVQNLTDKVVKNEKIQQWTEPKMLPYFLAGLGVATTFVFAILSWMLTGQWWG